MGNIISKAGVHLAHQFVACGASKKKKPLSTRKSPSIEAALNQPLIDRDTIAAYTQAPVTYQKLAEKEEGEENTTTHHKEYVEKVEASSEVNCIVAVSHQREEILPISPQILTDKKVEQPSLNLENCSDTDTMLEQELAVKYVSQEQLTKKHENSLGSSSLTEELQPQREEENPVTCSPESFSGKQHNQTIDISSDTQHNLSEVIQPQVETNTMASSQNQPEDTGDVQLYAKDCQDSLKTDDSSSKKVEYNPIDDLEIQQQAIFARLKRIQDELDKMSIGSQCQSSGQDQSQTCSPALPKVKFQDLVIGVDPKTIPLSILVLYQELSRCLKVKTSVFVHSSVKEQPSEKQRKLFDLATPIRQPGDSRLSNDILLTFIYKDDFYLAMQISPGMDGQQIRYQNYPFPPWKCSVNVFPKKLRIQVRQGCSLMIDPEKQTHIYGEVNVARYLSRLINPAYDSDPVKSTQIDVWVDKASRSLWNGNAAAKNKMIKDLDKTLATRKWLVPRDLSLADIVCWSGIHENDLAKYVPSNVEVWMKTCASQPMFDFVKKVL